MKAWKLEGKNQSNLLHRIVMLGGFAVALMIIILFINGTVATPDKRVQTTKDTNVLFMGHLYGHVEDSQNIFNNMSLYPWDRIVLGGDTFQSQQQFDESFNTFDANARELGVPIDYIRGNHDGNLLDRDYSSRVTAVYEDGLQLITLDFYETNSTRGVCGLTDTELFDLRDLLNKSADQRVIFMHHAPWSSTGFSGNTAGNVSPSECQKEQWARDVHPLIKDKVNLVVSGDGGKKTSFDRKEKDGVRYVVSGSPSQGAHNPSPELYSKQISALRIQLIDGQLNMYPINFANSQMIDYSAFDDIKTYKIKMDKETLRTIYATTPFYDRDYKWYQGLEDDETTEEFQKKYDVTIDTPDGEKGRAGRINIRGNLGNHWRDIKKSWDMEFSDREDRQIKFIIPDDRIYINQMIVEQINDSLGLFTPHVEAARLIINDIDFGMYVLFEDVDKPFIELAEFNSDAVLSKNTFQDHLNVYDITKDLAYIEAAGSIDRSDQQNVTDIEMTSENINNYYDQDSFARWLALQLYTSDRHQHYADNFRFVLDRATGRYVMFTWDAYIRPINKDHLPPGEGDSSRVSHIGIFWGNEENKQLTLRYTQQLIDSAEKFKRDAELLADKYQAAFENDATMFYPEKTVRKLIKRDVELTTQNAVDIQRFVDEHRS